MRSSTSSPGRVPPPRRRPRRSGRSASTHGRMAARCACAWVCTRASRPSRTRATTASVLADDELEGITLRDLGEYRLKDFERPEHIHQLVVMGLPDEFPSPRTAGNERTADGLDFRLLGPLEVSRDGDSLELRGPKQRGLLA